MPPDKQIAKTCPADFAASLEWVRDETLNDRVDGPRTLSFRNDRAPARCIIAANHKIGEVVTALTGDGIVGYHLSTYFEQFGALAAAA